MKHSKEQTEHAFQVLSDLLEPGSIVYTACFHVSKSGMTRRIRCYVVADGQIVDISYYVSRVDERSIDDDGLLVQGCGMDMGLHVVDQIQHHTGHTLRHRWL